MKREWRFIMGRDLAEAFEKALEEGYEKRIKDSVKKASEAMSSKSKKK